MLNFYPMDKPRISTIILVLALIVSVLAAGNFYLGMTNEQTKREAVEVELEKVKAAKALLEKEKEDLTSAKETLESQLNDATTRAKQLADQIAEEKQQHEDALNQSRQEAADLKSNLDQERKEKMSLTQELAKAKKSYEALGNELTTLRQAKEALEKRVKEMLAAQASETERIVVKPAAAAAAQKGPEGKVLVLNKEYNFVVVNLGSKDGLKAGTKLSILRGDAQIGSAQVEKLYESMSAANLLMEESKGQIQEGDLVRVVS